MTPWHRNEYLLKGVFLGLWTFFALQVPADRHAAWVHIGWVLGWVGAGLLLGLIAGTVLQFARGLRPWHNWAAFPLLVLLESPTFIYGGIVLGLVGGVLSGREFAEPWASHVAGWFGLTFDQIKHLQSATLPDDDPNKGKLPGDWLGYCTVAGLILGFGLYRLRQTPDRAYRFWAGLAIIGLTAYAAGQYAERVPTLETAGARLNFGLYLLMGLPFFYLLAFCGDADESEVEIMAFCAVLAAGLNLIDLGGKVIALGPATAYLFPGVIYFAYCKWVLPGLRVFKHTLRGYSYMSIGRLRTAIGFFRRALDLDPKNQLARRGLLALHNSLSLTTIDREPELVEALDFALCLDRASALLLNPNRAPTAAERAEAGRFLELVERKKPVLMARVDYLRAVSLTHAKDYDAAADTLRRLLDPETPYQGTLSRKNVLFPAWNLALLLHPEVVKRLGWKELDKPGRRLEAIGAVERQLGTDSNDSTARELKTVLYSQLSEAEFVAAAANGPPADFNYEYVEQLGLALADDTDPDRRERGTAYLRIAGRGLSDRAPGIFKKLADLADKQGDRQTAHAYLEQVKRAGQHVGPKKLAKDQLDIYFAALRRLAEEAEARGDFDAAIDELRLYLEGGSRNELDTYRRLADLYGKKGDSLNGLLMVETGLTYSGTDPDLLRKKDSFYYSVPPEKLAGVREKVGRWFDVEYCYRKAMSILNAKGEDLELLDWATHLAKLAKVMKPESNGVRLVEARCMLRRGDRDAGISILEDIHEAKKGSGEDEDAWYAAAKILGQLYLDELNRPDLAVKAFTDYKEYSKSGADTLYQLGRAYEAMGDQKNAIRFYEAVTAYEEHPRYWDAKEAVKRLRGQ
jgi:tetratricopeptide (TPR) repeat protein